MSSLYRSFPLTLVLLGLTAGMALADDAPATADDLRQLLNDKKYSEVIQKASKALTFGGAAAQGQDRYDLLMIKAEAQLLSKQNMVAADTFTIAAKEARSPNDAAIALGTSELAKRSPNLKYTPSHNGTPIDISDPADRKSAFTALYADMSSAMAPGLKEALTATELPSIMGEVKRLAKLKPVEICATGSATQTVASVKELAVHAQDLMATALRNIADEVKKIHDNAAQVQSVPLNGTWQSAAQGLGSRDKNRLKQIINECDQIVDAATQVADLTEYDGIKSVQTQAQQVKTDAQSTLTTDYMAGSTPMTGNNGAPLTPVGPTGLIHH